MGFVENDTIMTQLNQLTQQMDQLTKTVEAINQKTDLLIARLDPLTASCTRMDTHINFVDNVYSTVRRPLDIVLGLVGGSSSSPRRLLPAYTQSEEGGPSE